MLISIVIPTMTFALAKKCIESLIKYTDLKEQGVEIVVVANGAEPEIKRYLQDLYDKSINVKCVWHDNPIGAVPALNQGIINSSGEYILLFNDDCEILECPKNSWLTALLEPFSDPKVMITGPFRMIPMLGVAGTLSLSEEDAAYGFIVFFMALIRRTVFDEIGLLDEQLKCGVDIDLCMKLKRKGYKIEQVPKEERLVYSPDGKYLIGSYPIWHQGEGTVHDHYGIEKWHEITRADAKILEDRYGTRKDKKVSIVIPTYGDSLERLKKCIDSIVANTDLSQVEIIIVANGCSEATENYIKNLHQGPFSLVSFDKPIGFTAACNEGTKVSYGEFIVFINDDAIILGNMWLPYLLAPFADPKVGITGPLLGDYEDTGRKFMMFFCACIRKKVFDDVGLFDEIFSPGGFEDIDFSYKAEDAGWELRQVPTQTLEANPRGFTGQFPIFHEEHHGEWLDKERFEKSKQIIIDRYGKKKADVVETNVEKLDKQREIFDMNQLYRSSLPVAQKKYELVMLQEFLKNEKIARVLEIGTYRGGTAILWAKFVEPHNGRVFCADLNFDWGSFVQDGVHYRRQVYNDTPYERFITEFKGDTHNPEFAEHIRKEVGMVDLLFIDGDHAYEGVKKDFEAFSSLVKTGGHIVFHDILDTEHHRAYGCNVAKFWNEIKHKYPSFEFIDNNEYAGAPHASMGIGVLKNVPFYAKKPAPKVLCSIPTKNRYDVLALCVMAVTMQTRKPDKLIIYDDGEHKDLRSDPIYKHIFVMLDQINLAWEVVFMNGKGQHHSHQMANKAGFDFVWRLDDDTIPEPDVLERLLDRMQYDIGAVGGAVVTPGQAQPGGTNLIKDIYHLPNAQWNYGWGEVFDVDHLYSSFLYRAGIVNYNLDLSPVAHREETLFTHELKRAGWKLLVDDSIRTWHYRQDTGGIRSHAQSFFYEHDEKIFTKKMAEWGYKLIPLGGGLGDHLAFLNIVPDLLKKYNHLIIGATFPEVFDKIDKTRATIIPFGHAAHWCDDNVYKWMIENNWSKHIIEAYREMYL